METIANEGYVTSVTGENGITTISFFHQAQNSLPGVLLAKLAEAILAGSSNLKTKLIILKSEGELAFCAGASFDELLQITTKEEGVRFFSGFAEVINACRLSKKIIIGRVHGKAVGGGVGIAAVTDYCFATAKASIKLSELTIGIGPFVIGPAVIRKIGLSAFSALAINASDFKTAEWAKEKGLYAEVFESPQDMDNAISLLSQNMVLWSPNALSAFKKTLWEGTDNWSTLLAERAAISGELVLSSFAQEAISKLKIRK